MVSASIRDDAMLKRHRSDALLKKHHSVGESLPEDVIELILERLPVKSLLCFKSVSKRWYSVIDSRHFQQRQLIHRMQSRGPDVLYRNTPNGELRLTRIVLGSPIMTTAIIPNSSNNEACHGSCDGLVCLYSVYNHGIVANPATGWHQGFPFSSVDHVIAESYKRRQFHIPRAKLGFGKDKFTGTYKIVMLYNSFEFGLDNVTTCEVFDFSTNAWRYVVPASPLRVICYHKPLYCDGSLHWFTECEETKVLSFDLHTETFQVVSKTPFAHVHEPRNVILCSLDNRLCVSEKNWPTQDIWSFDSSSRGWKKMCSLDLTKTFAWYGIPYCALIPIAIPEKNKLLIQGPVNSQVRPPLVIHDLRTKSYDLVFNPTVSGDFICYFESLVSPLSN